MKIPVFVSCPTVLSSSQDGSRAALLRFLDDFNLEPRALGRSDYPAELPLREVVVIARHCAGGLILGFEQFQATSGTWKRGTPDEKPLGADPVSLPSSWNHLESGILYGLGLPLLIFREATISGGVFDHGATDVFIHRMPAANLAAREEASLKEVFLKWYGKVSTRYYGV